MTKNETLHTYIIILKIRRKKMGQYSCEFCSNYVYDEEYEEYGCVVSMDEDDYARQLQNPTASCPYFSYGDEYRIARKQ